MPINDTIEQLHQERSAAQNKHTYYLMALAGACIAFAVTQGISSALTFTELPWLLALILWALSIALGLWWVKTVDLLTEQNINVLRVTPEGPNVGRVQGDAVSQQTIKFQDLRTKASRIALWQIITLAMGAVSFIAWVLLRMYLRMPLVP